MAAFIKTFSAAGSDYEALNEACEFLKAHGFTYGAIQNDAMIGVMLGDVNIAKWRKLSGEDLADLHGRLEPKGKSFRSGPVTLRIRSNAPQAVFDALKERVPA